MSVISINSHPKMALQRLAEEVRTELGAMGFRTLSESQGPDVMTISILGKKDEREDEILQEWSRPKVTLKSYLEKSGDTEPSYEMQWTKSVRLTVEGTGKTPPAAGRLVEILVDLYDYLTS